MVHSGHSFQRRERYRLGAMGARRCSSRPRASRFSFSRTHAHPDGGGDGLRLQLDDHAFSRKLSAVRRYASLAGEAGAALERHGLDAFRTEFVRASTPLELQPSEHAPYYEQVGNDRLREGRYRSVLRYGDHVRPVLAALGGMTAATAHASPFNPFH